ncbi:transcription elongation factor NusA [Caldivirga sp. UBA161]|uniref:transcription elongation factor NusA n=1 Tax=Caldivirga sp. UBA161 TaxID=1915569 RepID=UPI0025BB062D|nr:transcription elongation factor NusA [Caldivirga sp. UBA161]
MRIPFCEFCVKTRLFCSKCQSLLNSGQYEMYDVDVIDAILKLTDNDQKLRGMLSNVEYFKSYEVNDTYFIALKGIRRVPINVVRQLEDKLSESLNRRVKIIEYTADINELVTQVAYPARPTVATTWLPDGTNETEVRIMRRDARRLRLRPSDMAKLLSAITNRNVKVKVISHDQLNTV